MSSNAMRRGAKKAEKSLRQFLPLSISALTTTWLYIVAQILAVISGDQGPGKIFA